MNSLSIRRPALRPKMPTLKGPWVRYQPRLELLEDRSLLNAAAVTACPALLLPQAPPIMPTMIAGDTGDSTATHFVLQLSANDVVAGTTVQLTVTVVDDAGQVVTDYTGNVFVTPQGQYLSPHLTYLFTPADQGVHTFSLALTSTATDAILVSTEPQTICVPLGAPQPDLHFFENSIPVQVRPGAATHFEVMTPMSLSAQPIPPMPGVCYCMVAPPVVPELGMPFTISVAAVDQFNNLVPDYTGTIHFSSTDPLAELPDDYAFTANDAGVHMFTLTFHTSGSQGISVMDGNSPALTGTMSVQVQTPQPVAFYVSTTGYEGRAGASFEMTVRIVDQTGRTFTGYTGTIHFSSSDLQGQLPADYTFTTDDQGVHTFVVQLQTAGDQDIEVNGPGTLPDGTPTVLSSFAWLHIDPLAASQLRITPLEPAQANRPFLIRVDALDPYGNVATAYQGVVHFASSDPTALVPPDFTFGPANRGSADFQIDFSAPGPQMLTVLDDADPSLTGSINLAVDAGTPADTAPVSIDVPMPSSSIQNTNPSTALILRQGNPSTASLSGTEPMNMAAGDFVGEDNAGTNPWLDPRMTLLSQPAPAPATPGDANQLPEVPNDAALCGSSTSSVTGSLPWNAPGDMLLALDRYFSDRTHIATT